MARKRTLRITVTPPAPPRPRNPLVLSPLMHRGGAHEKSIGAQRRAARMALQRVRLDSSED